MDARIPALSILIFLSACGPTSSSCARLQSAWIENDKQAILAARKIWYCLNPRLARLDPLDEQDWLREFVASRRDGTWHISQTLPEGYAGGGVVMDLAQRDGRLLNIEETQ